MNCLLNEISEKDLLRIHSLTNTNEALAVCKDIPSHLVFNSENKPPGLSFSLVLERVTVSCN